MRTSAARLAAFFLTVLATPSATAADVDRSMQDEGNLAEHFSIGAGAEVDLVGLAFGVRPEVLFRPVANHGANLRFAAGLLAGPEITFFPIALGYRQIFRQGRKVQPHLGGGFELQTFWYGGDSALSRPAFYVETGFEAELFDGGWIGLQYGPDFAPFNLFGFGFVGRVTFRYDL